MRLEARKYLYDIQEAAGLASQFTAGKSFANYQQDAMLRMAMERAFAIIGEALAQLARVDAALAAKITDFRSIVAFRNILVHAYAQVDERIVWDIVQSKLPVLVREVAALMDEGGPPMKELGYGAGTIVRILLPIPQSGEMNGVNHDLRSNSPR